MNELKNTYITYNKLLELVHPYFAINWWEDILKNWEIAMLINMSIQDLLNTSSFSFMSDFEILKEYEDYNWTHNIFYTKKPINKVHEIFSDNVESIEILPNRFPKRYWEDWVHIKTWTNVIYTPKHITNLWISYEVEYEVNNLTTTEERNKLLPIPFKFVPALIKLIYDHSSILTFIEWEWTSTDYFWHYINRVKQLTWNDTISTNNEISF